MHMRRSLFGLHAGVHAGGRASGQHEHTILYYDMTSYSVI